MARENINTYVAERLQNQREWYGARANSNKRKFMNYQKTIIILGAVIPLLVVMEGTFLKSNMFPNWSGFVGAFISATISVVAGFDKLQQPQDNWYNYRATEEVLKKEEWWFKFEAGPYANLPRIEAEKVLVERVENAIASDMANFLATRAKEIDPKDVEEKLPDTDIPPVAPRL